MWHFTQKKRKKLIPSMLMMVYFQMYSIRSMALHQFYLLRTVTDAVGDIKHMFRLMPHKRIVTLYDNFQQFDLTFRIEQLLILQSLTTSYICT